MFQIQMCVCVCLALLLCLVVSFCVHCLIGVFFSSFFVFCEASCCLHLEKWCMKSMIFLLYIMAICSIASWFSLILTFYPATWHFCWKRALSQSLSSLLEMHVQPDFTLWLITLHLSLLHSTPKSFQQKVCILDSLPVFPSCFDIRLTSTTLWLQTMTLVVSKCANGFLKDTLASH